MTLKVIEKSNNPTQPVTAQVVSKPSTQVETNTQGVPITTAAPNPIVQKFEEVQTFLNETVYEKEHEVEAILALLISRQHGFMLGVPGVGKSYLINKVMECVTGATTFEKLMMATTTPEELFGPISLSALRNDELRFNTAGYLAEAHVAFIDEVWKANSQTSNSKLTLMNERKFHNGNQVVHSPLISLFGASNELPSNSSLEAIYDRFVVRMVVDKIRNPKNLIKMLTATPSPAPKVLSLELLEEANRLAKQVSVEPVLEKLVELRAEMEGVANGEVYVSDRRWKMILSYMQGLAVLRGATALDEDFFPLIGDCLWSDPKHRGEISALLSRYASTAVSQADRLYDESVALFDAAMKCPVNELSAIYQQLKSNRGSIEGQIREFPEKEVHIRKILNKYDSAYDAVKTRYLEAMGL